MPMPITKNPASQISVLGVAPAFAMRPPVHLADDPVSEPAAAEPGMRDGRLQTAPLRARSEVGQQRFPVRRAFWCRVGVPAARYDSGESTGLRASGERIGQDRPDPATHFARGRGGRFKAVGHRAGWPTSVE